ncbi:hypothetical protein WA026_011787 [Henosepilachna vigintioctopunctata]|uniref:Uncharacterized protein n=1 Tax=Henosepilachna vigintioctopunctata TaxID=420089 RepID=A0AAW1UI83_9CUCU
MTRPSGRLWNHYRLLTGMLLSQTSRLMQALCGKIFPTIWIKNSNRNEIHISPEVKELKNNLDALFVISKRNPEYLFLYKKTKILYDTALKKMKQNHYRTLIENSKNKSKTSWNILRNLTGKNIPGRNAFSEAEDHALLAEKFNEYYTDLCSESIKAIGKSPALVSRQLVQYRAEHRIVNDMFQDDWMKFTPNLITSMWNSLKSPISNDMIYWYVVEFETFFMLTLNESRDFLDF